MNLPRRRLLHLAAGAVVLPVASRTARAQVYPSRPVTIIVPVPPGGVADPIARILADHLAVTLGQPVVIENVTGAGGSIGVGRAARAAPDGYTLSIGNWLSHVGASAVYPVQYDVLKDFEAVSLLTNSPILITARALLHRQAGLGAVERLDLALLIDRQNNGVVWRTDIEPDGIQANISPLRVLQSAFDFDLIRPGWLVLGAGLIVVALDFACARFAKQRRAARQVERVLAARLIRHPSDRLATLTASAARHRKREVWLSAIFDFYTEDFLAHARAWSHTSNRYRAAQIPSDFKVHFLEYRWTVNHRKWAYVR
jgi:hypothetical protein